MAAKLFSGRIVYYAGSIRGVPETDPDIPWKIVQYMINNGADVLSEHVAARNRAERDEIRKRRMNGVDVTREVEPWCLVRDQDIAWIDQATHMVALVNGASHGVGMEIQYALDKPRMGMNFTPILCLIRYDPLDSLTWMVRGVKHSGFYLRGYGGIDMILKHVRFFLLKEP